MGDSRGRTIGEVAELIGVSVMTIRSWERRYGWPRPARTAGAHRRYDDVDVERLKALAELRRSMPTGEAIRRLKAEGRRR
jgi:DNA-binding transcriptional MerR regulator